MVWEEGWGKGREKREKFYLYGMRAVLWIFNSLSLSLSLSCRHTPAN